MKIIFFGLGSIGQRHANILLKKYKHELYAFRSSINKSPNSLGIKELHSWNEVKKIKPDIAFITNPTSLHIETAIACAEIGCKLFIEKPIGNSLNGLDKLIKIVKKNSLVTYIAYNLRFHPIIINLKKNIDQRKPLHIRVVCTSFLPNWKPNTNYLKSYSANNTMGGGVILDLSHELDYVSYLTGSINSLDGNFSKRGEVTVNTEDYADFLLDTKNCPVNIHVNFFSQLKQRYIQIDFYDLTVIGDIINTRISQYQKELLVKNYNLDYQKDQEYNEQMKYFFDNINNPKMMNNLIEAVDLYKKIIEFKYG